MEISAGFGSSVILAGDLFSLAPFVLSLGFISSSWYSEWNLGYKEKAICQCCALGRTGCIPITILTAILTVNIKHQFFVAVVSPQNSM